MLEVLDQTSIRLKSIEADYIRKCGDYLRAAKKSFKLMQHAATIRGRRYSRAWAASDQGNTPTLNSWHNSVTADTKVFKDFQQFFTLGKKPKKH